MHFSTKAIVEAYRVNLIYVLIQYDYITDYLDES